MYYTSNTPINQRFGFDVLDSLIVRETRKVSIIIPNFNHERFLQQAIQSALNQTYSNKEVIVIDDGSTDNSIEVLENFANQIYWYRTQNRGSCAARNLGILKSTGDLIAFLDSDDYWEPNKILAQVEELESRDVDLVYCGMKRFYLDRVVDSPVVNIDYSWFLKNPCSTPFPPSTVLMTRDLLSLVGSWNTFLTGPAEDFDFFRRCAKFGRIYGINLNLVWHREHDGSMTSSGKERYFMDNYRALKVMHLEDRSMMTRFQRLSNILTLYINFTKHAVVTHDHQLFWKIVKQICNVKK